MVGEPLRLQTIIACYVAWQDEENRLNENSQKLKEDQDEMALDLILEEARIAAEQSQNRG